MSTLFPMHHEKVETAFCKNHLTTALSDEILCSICLEKDLESPGTTC